jgi:hypothetical protein
MDEWRRTEVDPAVLYSFDAGSLDWNRAKLGSWPSRLYLLDEGLRVRRHFTGTALGGCIIASLLLDLMMQLVLGGGDVDFSAVR